MPCPIKLPQVVVPKGFAAKTRDSVRRNKRAVLRAAARGKVLNSPKPIFREAALEGLIDDPEMWFKFIDDRNETVHTFQKEVANSIFADLRVFDTEMTRFVAVLRKLKV